MPRRRDRTSHPLSTLQPSATPCPRCNGDSVIVIRGKLICALCLAERKDEEANYAARS